MNDLIDRQQAIKELISTKRYCSGIYECGYVSEGNPYKLYNKIIDDIIGLLNSLPSIKSKKKKGIWKLSKNQTTIEKIYHCSECGYEAWGTHDKTNYCPNCGTRMMNV